MYHDTAWYGAVGHRGSRGRGSGVVETLLKTQGLNKHDTGWAEGAPPYSTSHEKLELSYAAIFAPPRRRRRSYPGRHTWLYLKILILAVSMSLRVT